MQKQLVIGFIAVLLAPALILAQKVSYDFDKTANFAGFKTYALRRTAPRSASS